MTKLWVLMLSFTLWDMYLYWVSLLLKWRGRFGEHVCLSLLLIEGYPIFLSFFPCHWVFWTSLILHACHVCEKKRFGDSGWNIYRHQHYVCVCVCFFCVVLGKALGWRCYDSKGPHKAQYPTSILWQNFAS